MLQFRVPASRSTIEMIVDRISTRLLIRGGGRRGGAGAVIHQLSTINH
jgi:hypothetical protein